MPLDTSIPLQAKAPESNPLATLLQVGQYKYQQQRNNQLQQEMASNQAVGQAIQANTRPDGSVDYAGVQNALKGNQDAAYNLQAATGTNLQQSGQQTANGTAQIGQQRAQFQLTDDMRQHLTQSMGELLNDPSPTYGGVVSKLLQAGQMYKIPSDVLAQSIANFPQTNDPNQIKSVINAKLGALRTPGEQQGVMAPEMGAVGTGDGTTMFNRDKLTGTVTPTATFQNRLAPGQQETIATDPLNNPYVVKRNAAGNIVGAGSVPGSYNPSTGQAPSSGPAVLPPGSAGDIKAVEGEVAAARQTANNAPMMRDLNRSIIAEVDKGLNTGSLGKLTQRVASATGYNLGSESATDYNVLGKMLERSAIAAAQSMGPQTNAGLEAQIRANGSLEYTPQAIRKIAVMNDALNTGAENYRTGLEKAIQGAGGNQLVKRQFDQQWSQNFDPRIMRLQNAASSGDKREIDAVLREVGGAGSKGANELMQKAQKLNQLINQGRM